jgi:hypothetical protein
MSTPTTTTHTVIENIKTIESLPEDKTTYQAEPEANQVEITKPASDNLPSGHESVE